MTPSSGTMGVQSEPVSIMSSVPKLICVGVLVLRAELAVAVEHGADLATGLGGELGDELVEEHAVGVLGVGGLRGADLEGGGPSLLSAYGAAWLGLGGGGEGSGGGEGGTEKSAAADAGHGRPRDLAEVVVAPRRRELGKTGGDLAPCPWSGAWPEADRPLPGGETGKPTSPATPVEHYQQGRFVGVQPFKRAAAIPAACTSDPRASDRTGLVHGMALTGSLQRRLP